MEQGRRPVRPGWARVAAWLVVGCLVRSAPAIGYADEGDLAPDSEADIDVDAENEDATEDEDVEYEDAEDDDAEHEEARAADDADDDEPAGIPAELSLSLGGATSLREGDTSVFSGTTYRTAGLSTLTELPRATVRLALVTVVDDPADEVVIVETEVRSDERARFVATLSVPETIDDTQLILRATIVDGDRQRRFDRPVTVARGIAFQVLTDRQQYEPGDTMEVAVRSARRRNRAAVAGVGHHVTLEGPGGVVLSFHGTTDAEGMARYHHVLPEAGSMGRWRWRVEHRDEIVDRLMNVATATEIRGRLEVTFHGETRPAHLEVRATAAEGTPLAQAELSVMEETREVAHGVTDAQGLVSIALPNRIGGSRSANLDVRAQHDAVGAIATSVFVPARTPSYRLGVVAEAGLLVPDVANRIYVEVVDAAGRPVAPGTEIALEGVGRPRVTLRTDRHGGVETTLTPSRAAAAARGQGCAELGRSIALTARILVTPPIVETLCLPIDDLATVLPRAAELDVVAGAPLRMGLTRARGAMGRPVLVELLDLDDDTGVLAATWVSPSDTTATVVVPSDVHGPLVVRARPWRSTESAAPLAGTAVGLPMEATQVVVLARPHDAFSLTLSTAQPSYRVRESAELVVERHVAADMESAPLTMLVDVRDVALLHDEPPFSLETIDERLRRLLLEGHAAFTDPDDRRLLARALASLAPTMREGAPPGLAVAAPTTVARYEEQSLVVDPLFDREAVHRRAVPHAMSVLERLVTTLGASDVSRRGIVERRGDRWVFADEAVETAIARGWVRRARVLTLGGAVIAPRHIAALEASFDFDLVARRVARRTELRVAAALARLGGTDDEGLERPAPIARNAIETAIARGLLSRDAVIDPWGRAIELRRTTRAGVLPLGEWLLGYELVSAGPDGRFETNDDVRDPLARTLPSGSLYAISVQEDRWLEFVSTRAIARAALEEIGAAWSRLTAAAVADATPDLVGSGPTEATNDYGITDFPSGEGTIGLGNLGIIGHGSGSGYGGGAGRGGMSHAAMRASLALISQSRLGGVLREEAPSTLFFERLRLEGARADVRIPLRDAVTTYRVEVIAWSPSGYATSTHTEFVTTQPLTLELATPSEVAEGDRLELPVRVSYRGTEPLTIALEATISEGRVGTLSPSSLALVPGQVSVVMLPIEVPRGEGRTGPRATRLEVRATAQRGGASELADGLARTLVISPDRRSVSARRDEVLVHDDRVVVGARSLFDGVDTARLEVRRLVDVMPPASGTPSDAWGRSDGLVETLAPVYLDDDQRRASLRLAPRTPEQRVTLQRTLAWLDDLAASRASTRELAGWLTLVAPADRYAEWPAVGTAVQRTIDALSRAVRTATITDRATPSAIEAAAALALHGAPTEYVDELLARAATTRVDADDTSFLAVGGSGDQLHEATALFALATRLAHRDADVTRLVRYLVRERAMATERSRGALLRLVRALGDDHEIVVRAEGGAVLTERAPTADSAVRVYEILRGVTALRIETRGAPQVATLTMEGTTPHENRHTDVTVRVDAPEFVRDVTSTLYVEVRAGAERPLGSSTLSVRLPAGFELDARIEEPSNRPTLERPTRDGRHVYLRLPPIARGRRIVVPLALRPTATGTVHGLAVSIDEYRLGRAEPENVALVPSRELAVRAPRPGEPARAERPRPAEEPSPPLLETSPRRRLVEEVSR